MKTLHAIVLASTLALGGFGAAWATGDKVPQTTEEHEQAAAEFRNKAKGHRAEAEMHRKMAEMYQTQIKGPSNRKPNAWLINMVKHCKLIAQKTDSIATEEEKAAELLSAQAKPSNESAAQK